MTLEQVMLLVFITAVGLYMVLSEPVAKRVAGIVGAVAGWVYVLITLVRTIR